MATPESEVLARIGPNGVEQGPPPPLVTTLDEKTRREIAQGVKDWHRDGLQSKYARDLTAEKYVMHIDGENDGQWAEIVAGSAVIVPPRTDSSLRFSHNLLRPLVDNFVAYFTAIPLRVVARSPAARRARDKSTIDTLLANNLIERQDLSHKLKSAMYLAAAYGSCPVHATWRYTGSGEDYHPLWNPEGIGSEDGEVDIWIGDPWDTVYDTGASFGDVHRVSYGRTIPTDVVKQIFPYAPDIADIEGSEDLPSASRFQQIARRWQYINQYWKGTATLATANVRDHDKLTAVICRETAPGVDPEWPAGKLEIVAYRHNSTTSTTGLKYSSGDDCVLLHLGPLPAGRLNVIPFYAHQRLDDVYGKPYVADLSDLQVQYNQIVTLRAERLKRYSTPQLMAQQGSIEEDTSIADGDSIMFVTGQTFPAFLAPPMGNPDYDAMLRMIEAQIFRIGGWQAASRGESKAGDPASKVVALARADDTIFGPVKSDFMRSTAKLLQLSHALFREYASQPVLAQVGGVETQHMVEPWIRAEDVSQQDPNFQITSGFGATPEAYAQVLSNMVTMRGADGLPLLTTAEFWDKYPDTSMKPYRPNLAAVRSRRLSTINYAIEALSTQAMQEYQQILQQQPQMMTPLVEAINEQVMVQFPLLRTDNPQECIMSLDELVQDPTTLPLVRMVAQTRQNAYFEWMQMMMTPNMAAPAEEAEEQSSTGTPPQGAPEGQSQSSNALAPGSAA